MFENRPGGCLHSNRRVRSALRDIIYFCSLNFTLYRFCQVVEKRSKCVHFIEISRFKIATFTPPREMSVKLRDYVYEIGFQALLLLRSKMT